MASSRTAAPFWGSILLGVLLWAVAIAKPSIPMDYCARINTAFMAANHSIYQSDGLCYGFCQNNFALAIVQDDSCWCSNFVPSKAVQVSMGQCNNRCPGFPDDVCGGNGLYGYMLLQKPPSGTVGTGVTSTPSSSAAPVTTETETVKQTLTQNTVTVAPETTETASSSESSTTTSSSNDNPSTSETPTVSTVTADGTVKTVTVTPTTVPTGGANSPNTAPLTTDQPPSGGLSAGAAAGVAVAVVSALLIVGGVAVWMFIKRRRRLRQEAADDPTSQRGSSAGMMAARTGEVSETRYYLGSEGAGGLPERRRSTLMPVDPRLDPYAKGIYSRGENSKSHDSVNTIRDDRDYSRRIQETPRVLRAVNPDPDDD